METIGDARCDGDARVTPRMQRSTGWTQASSALPREGARVEFLIDTRTCECALAGTYVDGAFVSHWARYESGMVREWRIHGPPHEESHAPRATPPSVDASGQDDSRAASPAHALLAGLVSLFTT